MHRMRWCLVPLVFLVSSAWSQQPTTTQGPSQAQSPTLSPTKPPKGKIVTEPPPCPAESEDSLATDGIVGKDTDGVTPPKLKYSQEAEFSSEARRLIERAGLRTAEFESVISFVLSVDGKPNDLCLKTPAGYGLDIQAAKAVWQSRAT